MLEHRNSDNQLRGTVELDETYVGGRRRGGRLSITPVPNAKRKTLEPIIHKRVKKGTRINSDEWWAYTKLCSDYVHDVVNHGRKEYVRGKIHTNTIEGAWSHLKRSIMGTYHRPSKEHLSKYCAEFEFTYNTRKKTPLAKFNQIIDKIYHLGLSNWL